MPDERNQPVHDVTYARIQSIPGWLTFEDFSAFTLILSTQIAQGSSGDLAELGVYLGKSAAVIGAYRRPAEVFTVVDLFEDQADHDPANELENAREYQGLSRREFERHYGSVHSTLPTIVQGPSVSIADVARHGAHRFVHIDASHLYDQVREDIAVARTLLRPDGIVVFDDIRSAHTPGVAAAAWAAVADGLHPLLLTGSKMYATWADPRPWTRILSDWLRTAGFEYEVQSIAGGDVHRLWSQQPAATRWIPPVAAPLARSLRARLRRSRELGINR